MTPDQRENLAVLAVGGATEGPRAWLARRRLEYARDLAEHGRIGETPKAACGASLCRGHRVVEMSVGTLDRTNAERAGQDGWPLSRLEGLGY